MVHAKRAFLLLMLLSIILAACDDQADSGSGSTTYNGPRPSPQLTLEEADQIAETFFSAWRNAEYGAMYSLISPNSRDAYSLEAFTAEYENTAHDMVLAALDTQITNSLRQGTTATIMYDVSFHSDFFGDITDTGRMMSLIETPEGWRVAWSRTDIFAQFADGGRLNANRVQPARGSIYDRNGNLLADQNGRAISLHLVGRDIADMGVCLTELARILNLDYAELAEKASIYSPEIRFEIGEVNPETFQAEEQILRDRCAIGDDKADTSIRYTRRYFGDAAPHIIGYVGQIQPEQVEEYERRGYPSDPIIGQEGIEKSYESYLAGQIGAKLEIVAANGITIRELAEIPAAPGQSVYLTIDRDLQQAVQEAFIDAYAFAGPTWAYTSPGAAAVVMDVKTGKILAMVSYPWFDPGLFNPDSPVLNRVEQIIALENDPQTPLVNRPMMGLYAAGSVFKIVSMAAGLDSGVYNENTAISCGGTWYGGQYGDALTSRTDWDLDGHGYVDFPHALTWSCDPYFWQLGVNLHNEEPQLLTNYAYEMGLGVPTGQTDLPEEVGQIPNDDLVFRLNGRGWHIADSLNLVIGQGETQITPLQITRMVAAVANGGTLYKPQFVNKVQLLDETPVYEAQPEPTKILDYDPHVFELIRDSMCNVTLDPTGTARYIYGPWYEFHQTDVTVCGKTGTAQTGGTGVKPQAWFAAFAPQDDPQIAVVVIVENSCEGSEVAAPIVARIVEDYYGMPHYNWPSFWQSGCFALGE